MEILIPGLILVALMAWASTKIKKRAADAFEAENIETEGYFMTKPEGFLHVLGDADHEFYAHTSEYAEEENSQVRRASIEIDILDSTSLESVREAIIRKADSIEGNGEGGPVSEIIAAETANQTAVTAFYKIMPVGDHILRLRFGVVSDYKSEYQERIEKTLESFRIKSN